MSYVITALYLLITEYDCCADVITRTIPEKAQREAGFDPPGLEGIDYVSSDNEDDGAAADINTISPMHSSDSSDDDDDDDGNVVDPDDDRHEYSDASSDNEGLEAAATTEFELYYNLPAGDGNTNSVSMSSAGIKGFGAAAEVQSPHPSHFCFTFHHRDLSNLRTRMTPMESAPHQQRMCCAATTNTATTPSTMLPPPCSPQERERERERPTIPSSTSPKAVTARPTPLTAANLPSPSHADRRRQDQGQHPDHGQFDPERRPGGTMGCSVSPACELQRGHTRVLRHGFFPPHRRQS